MKNTVYMLLDRSGSMQSKWHDSINGINKFVSTLLEPANTTVVREVKDGVETTTTIVEKKTNDEHVYLACFDQHYISGMNHWGNRGLDYLALQDTSIQYWKPMDYHTIKPRGGTPLNDAADLLISKVWADKPDRATIIFITDGEENASKQFPALSGTDVIRGKISALKEAGYQVLFIGADFENVQSQARSYGVSYDQTISTQNSVDTMEFAAAGTRSYNLTGSVASFDAGSRLRAKRENNQPRDLNGRWIATSAVTN